MTSSIYDFPDQFLWGTATAAHQVEGYQHNNWSVWEEGGKGRVWGNIPSGAACDWWRNAERDFDLAADLGTNAHRMSVEWSRIEPEPGRWDESALERYREMLTGLISRGIQPMVTLHHFTNPIWIEEMGSWTNDRIPEFFERYVDKVVSSLGDLVSFWCTINEPLVYATQVYLGALWPPAEVNLKKMVLSVKHMLLAHARAYYAIKNRQPHARVGLAAHQIGLKPAGTSPVDWPLKALANYGFNRVFLNGIRTGKLRLPGMIWANVPQARRTLDWIGLNYYHIFEIQFNWRDRTQMWGRQLDARESSLGTDRRWGTVHPETIASEVHVLWNMLRLPIYVTETGLPGATDEHRPEFMARTLAVLSQAAKKIPLLGLYVWTLVDNFEWSEGYNPDFRFGLIEVDFDTQERRVKRSGHMYRDIISAGGLTPEIVMQYAGHLMPRLFPGVVIPVSE